MAATYRRLTKGFGRGPARVVPVVRLRQAAGPVYDSLTRARYIAAHRAAKAGVLQVSAIEGQMAKAGVTRVPERTVRQWVSREPDLPELLLRSGLATSGDFPQFARPYVKQTGGIDLAQLRQTHSAKRATCYRPATVKRSDGGGLGDLVEAAFLLWAGVQVLQAITQLTEPRRDYAPAVSGAAGNVQHLHSRSLLRLYGYPLR